MFHGVITALVTPFKNGKIDEEAFCVHIDRQIEAGVQGVVPAGSTGEAATLSFEEHKQLIHITVAHVHGRVPVIAGAGSNNTEESIALTKAAKAMGADAALLISPYYNKPSQEGIYQHYKAIAEAVNLPQLLYNVPGRTASNILPETVARLSTLENIIGIKDATADMAQFSRTMQASDASMGFYSGDDATVLPFLLMGGAGVISVVSNIAPEAMISMVKAAKQGDLNTARKQHLRLLPLSDVMFIQSNPIPVKAACAMMGWMDGALRLPLVALPEEQCAALMIAMKDFGLQLA